MLRSRRNDVRRGVNREWREGVNSHVQIRQSEGKNIVNLWLFLYGICLCFLPVETGGAGSSPRNSYAG